jgi:hypothetical protein
MRTKPKEERNADVRTIFKKVAEYIHLDTGKKLTGHYCLICKYVFSLWLVAFHNILARDKGVSQKVYFFAGGVSSLCTHIARYVVRFLLS